MIPKKFFNPDNTGTLRLLDETEWRGIGITQSLGWEHYEVHGERDFIIMYAQLDIITTAPEPHVLLFRRPKNFDQELKRKELELQEEIQSKSKTGAAGRRK